MTDAQHAALLGLTPAEAESLDGFSSCIFTALAYLRDAWTMADSWNKRHTVHAMKDLLASKTMQEHYKLTVKTLKHTLHLQQVSELLEELHPYLTGKLP